MASVFSKQSDRIVRIALLSVGVLAVAGIGGLGYVTHPDTLELGYAPDQPVPYSHKLHAGNMGMDCRYCHSTVEKSSYAAIPATQVCMNCHERVKPNSPQLAALRESWQTGNPVEWVKIHRLPDFVYFNHQAHVTAGVSCVSCHGRVDQMPVVKQVQNLSMSWCLECHRNPAANLRPAALVTKLDWQPDRDPVEIGREIIAQKGINPPTNCSGCHR